MINERIFIHNDGDNMSDHLAILCTLSIPAVPDVSRPKKDVWKPMWDRTNTKWYQAVVTENLSNIYLPLDALYRNNNDCYCHHSQIERYYRDIVQCLKLAENTCVPVCKVGFHKHWWSPELDDMKQKCIDITNLWTSVGRPRCGTINAERLRCKLRYKQAIKEASSDADKDTNDGDNNH